MVTYLIHRNYTTVCTAICWLLFLPGASLPAQSITESFDLLTAPSAGTTYASGSYVGDAGDPWTYTNTRTQAAGITGSSAELRKLNGAIEVTLSNGLGSLTFDHLEVDDLFKSILNVSFNGEAPTTYETRSQSGVITIVIDNLTFTGTTTVRIANVGNQAILLDNVSWTENANSVPVAGITLNKNATELPAGQSERLDAAVSPANASNPSVTWVSSDASVATVDETGLVTATGQGTAQITATAGESTASCTVTVTPAEVVYEESFVRLDAPTASLADGSFTGDNGETWTYERAGTVLDGITGQSIELRKLNSTLTTTIPIDFDSLAFSIRTVAGGRDRSGKVQIIVGSDTLGVYGTVTSGVVETFLLTDLGATAGTTLTVNGTGFGNTVVDDLRWGDFPPFVPVAGVNIDPSVDTLTEGTTLQLNATVLPANATEQGVSWWSTDPTVATVDGSGLVAGQRPGTASIVVVTEEGGFTDTLALTINELRVPDDLVIDAQGWSDISARPDSRVIYCSDSEGDDNSDGLSRANAVKTLDKAFSLLRNGQPDHVYLKRGDTWTDQDFSGLGKKSGKNSFDRMVVAYYGDGPRPLIKLNNQLILNDAISQVAIVGIEFYNYPANPADPEYRDLGTDNLVAGFRFVNQLMSDVLIEDCKLSYFGYHLTIFNKAYADANGSGDAYRNFDIRRNILTDAYQLGATDAKIKSQGVFVSHTHDFLFEENFLDHNGWNEELPSALPNQYNHNLYMSVDNEGEIIVRGNVISRGAAHGVQLRSGGLAARNAFIGNAIGMNVGYASFPTFRDDSTVVVENVVTDGRPQLPGDFTEPQTGAVWGLWKQSINDLRVSDNIVANIADTLGGNMKPYNGMAANEFGSDNIAWNWVKNSVPTTNPGWTDPTRNAESYAQLNGYENYDAWVAAASSRGIREFSLPLSAYGYIDYIRAGFDKAQLDSLPFELVAVTGIDLNVDRDSLAPGQTIQLLLTVVPVEASDKSVNYTSSDEAVATVNGSGLITTGSEGTATILARTNDGGFTDTLVIVVTDAARIPPTSVTLNVGDTTINAEEQLQLEATVLPVSATFPGVSWASTDPGVATVDNRGLVTATGGGTAAIIVTTDDENLTDTAILTVIVPIVDLPIDADGWTVAAPSADSRLIYCSDFEGDDANDGLSAATPVKTLDRAFSLLRDGFPDWVNLKRGDTWTDQDFDRLSDLSGRSGTERIVVTYYGQAGDRPLLKTNNSYVLNNADLNHVAIIGVEFYNYTANPLDANFVDPGKEGVRAAFRFVQVEVENLLFEDCKFSYYADHFAFFNRAAGRGDVFDNIEFRRNIFLDAYQRGSTDEKILAQGMFVSHTEDFLLEENFFDHNGWNEELPDAQPNQFNHNVYLSTDNAGPMVVRGNVISRAAAHGVQLRSGGVAEHNAFIGNAIGMNMGFGSPPTYYDGPTTVANNVVTDGRPQIPNDFTFPQTGAVWGLWKQSITNLSVDSNIVANIQDTTGGNMKPYNDMAANDFGTGNIAWNWTRGDEPATDPGWLEPTRDKDSYATALGYVTYDDWVTAASNRSLRTFPAEFTAQSYVEYVREGFTVVAGPNLTVGDCEFTEEDFFGSAEITAVGTITYADFSFKRGSYVIGIGTGIRSDGLAGAWEIHNDCTIETIRRTGQGDRITRLPDVWGVERNRGWRYLPTSISADGQYIYGTALNKNGFTHARGWTIAPGTTIDIRWKLGGPFYGRIFGVKGEIRCDDLEVITYAGNYFVTGCNDAGTDGQNYAGAGPRVQSQAETQTQLTFDYEVYPNPTTAPSVSVRTSEPARSISIIGLNGQVLRRITQPGYTTRLDLSDFVKGVYIVEIAGAEAVVRTKLIVN